MAFGRRLASDRYVVGADGNLSVRVPGGMLITPSGLGYDVTGPDDIVRVAEEGAWDEKAGRRPSSERALHAAIYAARADVAAIIHAHPVHACALAVRGTPLPPILDEVEPVLGGQVEVAEHVRSGEPALGTAAVRALGARQAVLLARHGTVTVGRDLAEAYYRLEVLERAAHVYLVAKG